MICKKCEKCTIELINVHYLTKYCSKCAKIISNENRIKFYLNNIESEREKRRLFYKKKKDYWASLTEQEQLTRIEQFRSEYMRKLNECKN